MIAAEDFSLVGFQTAIFTPGLVFRAGRVAEHLMSRWGEKFNGEPVLFPQFENAPPEFPRLRLESTDSRYRLQAGSTRLDVFWEAKSAEDKLEVASHLAFSVELFLHYLEATRALVGRLAAVIRRKASDTAPAITLARHFCRDRWLSGPLNRPADFQLHAHKVFDLPNSFHVNSWFRCRTGQVGPGREPAVLVEQDFNTLAEELEKREYGPKHLRDFFSPTLCEELDKVLELYFPKE